MILSWVMSILAVVALSVCADLLLGGRRIGKFVKSVFASLTILIIVSPLPNLLNAELNTDGFLFGKKVQIDENFVQYSSTQKACVLEEALVSELSRHGYKQTSVSISGQFDSEAKIEFVSINLRNLVMDEKVSHINKYDAVTRIASEFLGVSKGAIAVYE
ncbi:MAG: hypothetical protein IKC35_04460 [Clostridia bacterium]|nr:hypothetical protein [Clostridia bacterium]